MSINASNYVVSYKSPTAPKINVNVRDVSVEDFEEAVTVYQGEASSYVDTYRAVVENKGYVEDRLKKDLCAECDGLTSGGINLQSNTIQLHVKADEVYAYAIDGNALTNANGVSAVAAKFDLFYSTYYQDDEHSSFMLQATYETAATYDAQAFTIDATVGSITSGLVFIVDAPNVIGTSRTYTNYNASNEAVYTLSYEKGYTQSHDDAWVIKEAGESGADVIYSVSDSIGDGMTWVAVEA